MPWDFSTEPEFQSKLDWMSAFVREQIWPLETLNEELGWEGLGRALRPLQEEVKRQGLWAAHLDPELGGQGFGQVKLGLVHEILGTCPFAPLAFGNAAPDSGNSEILALAGSPEQKERYLYPLLAGDLKSAFSMTEPETAGSDPTLLETAAVAHEVHRASVARQVLRGYQAPPDGIPSEHVPTRRQEARERFAELLQTVTAND